ncbi:transposase [Chamaesiphon sp.]|uniref:helix-turn-helix domain-containing protein n=1 Tax=Chamaesiphon sp. TaxID=2814140 RepID=UPI003593F7FF
MAGVTSIIVKESLEEIAERLRQATQPIVTEKLQVLYWLKQEKAPSISKIAASLGRHRGTLQEWLRIYRTEGISGLELVKSSPGGGRRLIPKWAEAALSKRLQEPENGFDSYGAVQQWLSETLGVEAEYHAVYQMTRYRLKAKLKVARPQHHKQNKDSRLAFKKTSPVTLNY